MMSRWPLALVCLAGTAHAFGPGPAHRTVYMNRYGGIYTQGTALDSSTNTVSYYPPGGPWDIGGFTFDDAQWNDLVACVQGIYAPFDVTVTDVDPGSAPHVEAVVGGSPEQLGQPSTTLGLAPKTNDCS